LKEKFPRGRGRILEGTTIWQNHRIMVWSWCFPPADDQSEKDQFRTKRPDRLFDVKWDGHFWQCTAEGYGNPPPHYGNGAIYVSDFAGVRLIEDKPAATMPHEDDREPSPLSPPEKALLELAKPILNDAINVLHVLEPFSDDGVPEEITLARKALKRVLKSLYY
jgi:hypothetical protein